VRTALKEVERQNPSVKPQLLTFLIHFGQWPLDGGAGTGSRLNPPQGSQEKGIEWMTFPLSSGEVETKREALLQYHSQMLIMGRFLLSFARANELFAFDHQKTGGEVDGIRRCEQ
jgi:hypothetical protein